MMAFEINHIYPTRGGKFWVKILQKNFYGSRKAFWGVPVDSNGVTLDDPSIAPTTTSPWEIDGKWLPGEINSWDIIDCPVSTPSKANVEADYERLHEEVRDGFVRTYKTNEAPFNAETAWKATKLAAGDAS